LISKSAVFLREAIRLLCGEILEDVAMDQTRRSPVAAGEPSNIAGEPVGGETAEYLVRLGK